MPAATQLDSVDLTPSEYIKRGPNSRLITGWFFQFLLWKFSTINNIEDPALRLAEYLWAPDDEANKTMSKGLLIKEAHRFQMRDADQRPAILIKAGAQTPDYGEGGTIGGNRTQSHVNLLMTDGHDPNEAPTLGQDVQQNFIAGEHQLMFIHKTGAAAEVLGLEVWNSLLDYATVMRRDCGLQRMQIGPISPAAPIRGYSSHWATATMLRYRYQRVSLVSQESPLLKAYSPLISQSN